MLQKYRLLALCAGASLLFACAKPDEAPSAPAELTTDAQKFGYAIGVDLGNSLEPVVAHVDVAALKQGLDDVSSGAEIRLDETAREQIKNAVSQKMQEEQIRKRDAAAATGAAEGKKFLAENATREGVETTESGLQYEVITEGDGPSPDASDEVTVHYVGKLINGEEFDSSIARGQPVTFPLNNVIPGWTEGVQLMKTGGKYRFFIPSELAYGDRGAGAKIGPNQTLIFEVELLGINKAEAGAE